MNKRTIPATNEITTYFHCGQCLLEKPEGISMRDWMKVEVGATPIGMQVWCRRHEVNIIHIDFQDQKHPVNGSVER